MTDSVEKVVFWFGAQASAVRFKLQRSPRRRIWNVRHPRFSSCSCPVCRLTFRREPLGHSSQILCSCCHQKLIMSTARTTQSQAIEFEDALEVSEEHFHLLSLSARLFVFWGSSDAPRFVTRSFVDAAHDFAKLHIRATSILHRTAVTVHLTRSVDDGVGFRDVCAGIPEWSPVAA